MNARKFVLTFLCAAVFSFVMSAGLSASPGDSQKTISIGLKNGSFMQVGICSGQIFRIRYSEKNEFPESLMERYELLKTDWEQVRFEQAETDGYLLVSTADYRLQIDKTTGALCVKDTTGEIIVGAVDFVGKGSAASLELGQSLDRYFQDNESGGGIIGDVNYTGEKERTKEISDFEKAGIVSFGLKAGERFYGGGSTSRKNIQHRGTALRMWATYQKTEIPMPFLMSSEGWGVFNNTTSKNYFDVGRFRDDRFFIYNTGGETDFYLLFGNSMPEVLNQYLSITGRPYVLPKWAYGLAFGGNMKEDQFNIMEDAIHFREEKIPCDIFWLEPQWMAEYYDFSTSKNWDYDKFPGEPFWEEKKFPKYEVPDMFISKLHGLGFKLALWLCIDHDLSIEEEDFLAGKAGKPQSGKEHWFPHLNRFADQGVDGFKLDPGRTLHEHPEREYYNGYTDKEMHNLNQVLLSMQMCRTFREHKGIRSFHHYCGGYAGSQHWGASTNGDNGGGKLSMYDQLNLSLSGFANTSVDVLDACDFMEGLHFGFFLPWVQINSWFSLRHPWYLPDDKKEVFSDYARLRNSLSPYIYSAALEGIQDGMPVMRAMPLAFPDDRKVDNMISQYMFGNDFLVGVFSDSVYLPKGNWIDYWTGESVEGGQTVVGKIPANRGGYLFVRNGAIIPKQPVTRYIGENAGDTLSLDIFPCGHSFYTLYEDDGISFDYEKGSIAKTRFECVQSGGQIRVAIHPCEGAYKNMVLQRAYEINIRTPKPPRRIEVNGVKIKNWQTGPRGAIKISLPKKDIGEEQSISIM